MNRYSLSNSNIMDNIFSTIRRLLSIRINQVILLLFCLALIFTYTAFDVMFWSNSAVSGGAISSSASKCNWRLGDPVFLNIKTSLGVNYDGGHWFHMSENLMTLHSILRNERTPTNSHIYNSELYSDRYVELSHAREVYYNFDKSSFLGDLNGVTRFLSIIGLTAVTNDPRAGHIQTETAYFVHTGSSALPGATTGGFIAPLSQVYHGLQRGLCQRIPLSNVSSDRRFMLTPDTECPNVRVPPRLRQLASSGGEEGEQCVKFLTPNTFGGSWPTPQRGHWFSPPVALPYIKPPGSGKPKSSPSLLGVDSATELRAISRLPTADLRSGDLVSFYDKMKDLCPPATPPVFPEEVLHITIYQRDLNRKVINLEETVALLEKHAVTALMAARGEAHQKYRFELQVVMHDNKRSPCVLRDLLSHTVLLFTPHGFQSLLVLLLPNAVSASTMPFVPMLFEVFPYRYYKRAYGPLSKELAVHHSSAMSPVLTSDRAALLSLVTTNMCMMWSKYCREYARGDNVKFTYHALNHLLHEIRFKLAPQFQGNGDVVL